MTKDNGVQQLTRIVHNEMVIPERITRQFQETPYAILVNSQLNEIYQERPKARKMLGILSAYPLLKWCVTRNKDWMDSLLGNYVQLGKLMDTQSILVEYGIDIPSVRLSNREKCIEVTEEILSNLENHIIRMKTFPGFGEKYYKLLYYIHISPNIKEVSRWLIKNHYKDALILLADVCENIVNESLDSTKPKEDEYYLDYYHDTKLLLMRYQRILWREGGPDKALQLLECESLSEMMEVTLNESKYVEACNLVDYIKIVYMAIEQLRTYPEEGELLHMLMDQIYTYGNNSLELLTQKLRCGKSTVYRLRKKALTALSLILWGATIENLFQLLD